MCLQIEQSGNFCGVLTSALPGQRKVHGARTRWVGAGWGKSKRRITQIIGGEPSQPSPMFPRNLLNSVL